MSKQKPLTYSCQQPGLKKCFIKGQALRHLRTDSSQTTSEENVKKFENRQIERGSSVPIVRKYLSELKFADKKTALQKSNKSARKNYYLLLHNTTTRLYLNWRKYYGEIAPHTKPTTAKRNL